MIFSARFVVTRISTKNSLHGNLQFTLEKINKEGDWAFLDININMSSKSNITCHWYQKPTDTGMILKFCCCAPLQHKKNVIQVTVQRVFNATSIWLVFDQALEEKKNLLDQKSVSRGEVSKNSERDFRKDNKRGKNQFRTTPKEYQKSKTRSRDKPGIFLQKRSNLTQNFASKLKKLCELRAVIITRKLRSCLPTLKSFFDTDLKFHVVYGIKCNGCGSIYVGQTSRHVATRITKHQKNDSQVGQHLVECCGATNDIQ